MGCTHTDPPHAHTHARTHAHIRAHAHTRTRTHAGADSLASDRLGCFSLSLEGHAEAVRYMRAFGVPMLVCGGASACVCAVCVCAVCVCRVHAVCVCVC